MTFVGPILRPKAAEKDPNIDWPNTAPLKSRPAERFRTTKTHSGHGTGSPAIFPRKC